ncbi:MAG: hypothetical protein ACRED5_07590 [Propylenella sp.]
MKVIRTLTTLGLALLVLVALGACRTSKKDETYNFDPAAHQRAVELKSKTLSLMAASGESYSAHRADAETLAAAMDEAHRLSAAAADNELVAAEWAGMKDASGDLYGGFARRWQANGRVDEAARDAAMNRVTTRFDYILCLEAAKRTKAGRCTPPGSAQPEAAEPGAAAPAPPPA